MLRGGGLVDRYLHFATSQGFLSSRSQVPRGLPALLCHRYRHRRSTWRYDDSNDYRDRKRKRRSRLYQMHNVLMGRLAGPLEADGPVAGDHPTTISLNQKRQPNMHPTKRARVHHPALVSAVWHPAPLPIMDANHHQLSRPINPAGKSWLVDLIPPSKPVVVQTQQNPHPPGYPASWSRKEGAVGFCVTL